MSSSFPSPQPEAGRSGAPFWKRWWFWAAVVVVVLIAAGASSEPEPTGLAVSPSSPASQATVVNVIGQNVDTATTELVAQGFEVRVTKLTKPATYGIVLQQSPAAGSTVEPGRTVVLVVAKPLPRVPNVIGDKLTKARSVLLEAGFGLTVRQQESSKPKGTVIAQSPKGGASAKPGRMITLVVAKAAPPPPASGYVPYIAPGPDVDCAAGREMGRSTCPVQFA